MRQSIKYIFLQGQFIKDKLKITYHMERVLKFIMNLKFMMVSLYKEKNRVSANINIRMGFFMRDSSKIIRWMVKEN